MLAEVGRGRRGGRPEEEIGRCSLTAYEEFGGGGPPREGLIYVSNRSSTRPSRWHLEFAQRTRLESMSGDGILQSLLTHLTCIKYSLDLFYT